MSAKKKPPAKLSSSSRLEAILEETEAELQVLQPKIEKLEKQLAKLQELKLAKQKLITLKLSIQSILSNFNFSGSEQNLLENSLVLDAEKFSKKNTKPLNKSLTLNRETSQVGQSSPLAPPKPPASSAQSLNTEDNTFLPELAFRQVDTVLHKKTSINYDLFRAIVFNGGQATTEAIKQYLLENGITQPANGESFDAVPLTDISARVNYLVRKGIVTPAGRGVFVSQLGWLHSVQTAAENTTIVK